MTAITITDAGTHGWQDWADHRDTVQRAVRSSLCCAIATTNPDGSAHVTPIGSVVLTEAGQGLYFEVFASRLGHNLDRDPRFTLLAVDSGKPFWLRSLARGRFATAPGIRLSGVAGARRPATDREQERFRRSVAPLRLLRGHGLLWSRADHARDLRFDGVHPIRLGAMTAGSTRADGTA